MNRPQLHKETVDILYQAYFNDTLKYRQCPACVVGNIIAARMGYKIKQSKDEYMYWENEHGIHEQVAWVSFVITTAYLDQTIDPKALKCPVVRNQLAATGYEPMEVALIEYTFENTGYLSRSKGKSEEEQMFDGLVAVLNVLDRIHEVSSEDLSASKVQFQEHYKNRCHANTTTISAG